METRPGFSEKEVTDAIRYSHAKYGFEVDARTLRQTADLVLEKIQRDPREKVLFLLREMLLGIRFEERGAYAAAISKMFSERSSVHRSNHKRMSA
ncbi:MAG: hypothetical protein Q8O94_00565 [bacterium]|nr:hypothetical protein [bacterium]